MRFFETIMENPLAQIFWFLAMFVAFIWLLQKNDKNTIKIIIISSMLWVIHFYLMWIYSAMAASIVWIARLVLSLKFKKNKIVFFWVIIAFAIMWLTTYENKLSLLPIIGSSISAYWYFFLEWFRLRLFIFISSILWLTFSINAQSIWWIINEIISQLILIFVMYKLIRESWKRLNILEKIASIFRKVTPDVGTFIIIYDYIKIFRRSIKFKTKILFYKINILWRISRANKIWWRFKRQELSKVKYTTKKVV
jgi:hypothetical protein